MQRFWRDDRGTYAVMAGIVTLPLLLGVGTAVDYSVGVLNQKELQSVLDSAVLAGALQLGAGNGAASDAAATYFNANVPGKLTGDAGQVPTTGFGSTAPPSMARLPIRCRPASCGWPPSRAFRWARHRVP